MAVRFEDRPISILSMARSITKSSQLAPVIYCQLKGSLVLVDGFKRLRAARTLKGMTSLQARRLEVDGQAAKSYDWTRNPETIHREPFFELATGEFLRRKENVAFVGNSGLGKTHLMQGVARKCRALGYRVRYETSGSLIEVLKSRIRLQELLERIGWKSDKGRGDQLRGPCPLPACQSKASNDCSKRKDRSFSIHASASIHQRTYTDVFAAAQPETYWTSGRSIEPRPCMKRQKS